MPIGVIATSGTGYPQTGANRSWGRLIADVARRVGGANDNGRYDTAKACVESAVRAYNVVLWKFNQTTEDLTLAAATDSYALNAYHAAPVRAYLLDSNGKQAGPPLLWVNYTAWVDGSLMDDLTTADPPVWYTALNQHELGTILVRPVPQAPTTGTYRKIRLVYLTRIAIPADDDTPLDAPQEIEHGIERWANAELIDIVQGPGKGSRMMSDAVFTKTELEQRYRAFPDH